MLALGAFVLWQIWDDYTEYGSWTAEDLSWMGRRLFEACIGIMAMVLVVATPVLVSQSVGEEKSQGTLQLLRMSGLTPRRILLGKVLSALFQLGGLMLGMLPLLVLATSFGGVGLLQVGLLVSVLVVGTLALAGLSAYFALLGRGPLLALAGCFGFLFVGGMLLPFPTGAFIGERLAYGSASLPYVFFQGMNRPHFVMGFALLCWLGLGWKGLRAAEGLFEVLASEEIDEDAHLLSPEFWAGERRRRRNTLTLLALVVSGLVIAALPWRGPVEIGLVLWNVAFFLAASERLLIWVRGLAFRIDRFLRARREREHARRDRVGWLRRRPPVLGNPAAWREVFTGAHGPLGRVLPALSIVGLGLLTLDLIYEVQVEEPALWNVREDPMVLGALGFAGCCLLACLLATTSMRDERRRNAAGVLCVSPLGAWGLLRGKLAGVFVYLLAPFAVSTLLTLYGTGWVLRRVEGWQMIPVETSPFLRLALTLAPAAAAVFAVTASSLWAAARARTAAGAWGGSLGLLAAYVVVPVMMRAMGRYESATASKMAALLNPMLRREFTNGALPWHGLSSAALWVVVGLLLLWRTRVRLERSA